MKACGCHRCKAWHAPDDAGWKGKCRKPAPSGKETMKAKKKTERKSGIPRCKYKISKTRILQICNDIAEEMGRYTKAELVEVVKYQCDVVIEECQKRSALRSSVVLKVLDHANGMLAMLRQPNAEVSGEAAGLKDKNGQ